MVVPVRRFNNKTHLGIENLQQNSKKVAGGYLPQTKGLGGGYPTGDKPAK